MSAIKKKSETCGEQLVRMCKNIAEEISAGNPEGKDSKTASAWMEDVYEIEWITYQDKTYKSARLLVAGGGPNIWVNLQTGTVDGYWMNDVCSRGFADNLGLDEYCEELYEGC